MHWPEETLELDLNPQACQKLARVFNTKVTLSNGFSDFAFFSKTAGAWLLQVLQPTLGAKTNWLMLHERFGQRGALGRFADGWSNIPLVEWELLALLPRSPRPHLGLRGFKALTGVLAS